MTVRRLDLLDHKVIGRLYLWYGLFFLLVGGLMAMLLRWQIAYPGTALPLLGKVLLPLSKGVVSPNAFAALFTLHGTIMLFFALAPVVIGAFSSYLVPLMVGTSNVPFPRLNLVGFLLLVLSGGVLLSSFFVPLGPAASGWTAYPPLSTTVGQPGPGQTLWVVAIILNGASSICGAVNTITSVAARRAPGLSFLRLPLTVWGLFLAAVLNALFVPVLLVAMLLLLSDRVFGTRLFVAEPVLYQHLFWIFGHPEVYILILPVWGIVSDVLSFFSRKPAFGYRTTVLALTGITLLSMLVYGHHMFLVGLSPLLTRAFMTLTLVISLPTSVLVLNWLGTLWKGSIRFQSPMLYTLGMVVVFVLGGLTGLHLGAVSTNVYLHDSAFVVGHFHLTMAASILLGTFSALHFWFPKLFGRLLDESLARWHFWLTFVPLLLVFGGMLVLGYAGMPRRIYDPSTYQFLAHLRPLSKAITLGALLLGAAQLIFLYNVFRSLRRGAPAPPNPWGVGTLEWTLASPPPAHGFEAVPTVHHGPHEFASPAATGKDWVSQDEAAR